VPRTTAHLLLAKLVHLKRAIPAMPIDHRTFVAAVRTVALRVSAEYTLEYRGGDQVDVLSCSEITD
jgi:hypothetical protein